MATQAQRQKLRRKMQDFYSKRTGDQLTATEQAFQDDELDDLIDDAFAEATDGASVAENANAADEAMAMLLARADGILMIAMDEARRIKWQDNNDVIDPSKIADNLTKVAKELRERYEAQRKRALQAEIEGVTGRPAGGNMRFAGSSVKTHLERNFNNATVRRNSSPDHY